MYRFTYNLLFPAVCVLCDKPCGDFANTIPESASRQHGLSEAAAIPRYQDLCRSCFQELPHNAVSCHRCALPLSTGGHYSTTAQTGILKCGKCLTSYSPIDFALVPFVYRAPIDYMIKRLKFAGDIRFARLTSQLLCAAINQHASPAPDFLLPVPAHPERFYRRGYNQAEQLATRVSRCLSIPLGRNMIERTGSLQSSQAALSATAREQNMRQAFGIKACCDKEAIAGKSVAIIDDVYTTGATTRSMARVLRRAGAKKISVWAIARTP